VFALTFVALGFAILVRAALAGGGTVGFVVGGLFVALGTARLYLLKNDRGRARPPGGAGPPS
jgi:hypothetical protein